MRVLKGVDVRFSKNFRSIDFDCHCKEPDCTETLVEQELVDKLQALRDLVGVPVYVTSGYRCAARQAKLARIGYQTAQGTSTHELGQAADILTREHSGPELEALAEKVGFKSIGVAQSWIHLDIRPDERRWSY